MKQKGLKSICIHRGAAALIAVFLLLSCGLVPHSCEAEDAGRTLDKYTVGAGDVLEINVYDEPDLSAKVRVSANGDISFPLLGKVEVKGLTTNEIESILTEGLARDYLVSPHVSVFIGEYGSKKVSISGEVKKPDIYILSAQTKLSEILATAGGLTENAGNVIFLETSEKAAGSASRSVVAATPTRRRMEIEVERLLVKGDTTCDYLLKNGDTIYVPAAEKFFVLGEVRSPGEYRLKKSTTILQAVAQAGGFTDIAASSKVKIIRVNEGKKDVILVNVDDMIKNRTEVDSMVFYLQADDVILVPESFF